MTRTVTRLLAGPVLTFALYGFIAGVVGYTAAILGFGLNNIVGVILSVMAYLGTYLFVAGYISEGLKTDNPISLPDFRFFDTDIFTNPRKGIPRWFREQAQWVSILVIAVPVFMALATFWQILPLKQFQVMLIAGVLATPIWIGERFVCQYGSKLFKDDHEKPVET